MKAILPEVDQVLSLSADVQQDEPHTGIILYWVIAELLSKNCARDALSLRVLYNYMCACISVPVNPLHLDCTITHCSSQACTTTESSTLSSSVTHQLNTSLHCSIRCYRSSLQSSGAPSSAKQLMAILPFWLTLYTLRGRVSFHGSIVGSSRMRTPCYQDWISAVFPLIDKFTFKIPDAPGSAAFH